MEDKDGGARVTQTAVSLAKGREEWVREGDSRRGSFKRTLEGSEGRRGGRACEQCCL